MNETISEELIPLIVTPEPVIVTVTIAFNETLLDSCKFYPTRREKNILFFDNFFPF